MIQQCEVCNIEIVAEDIVVSCEGLCEEQRFFHAKCVGLSYDEGCACLHQNIFWVCNSCRDAIEYARFRKAFNDKQNSSYVTKSELDCLKTEVKRISETISQIEINSTSVSNPSTSSGHLHRSNDKHSSPLSSTKRNAVDFAERTLSNDILHLYVSNIAPDVTEHEIEKMVCESVGAPEVLRVKCLVPSWMNISDLNYVSYKVSVDAQFRETAFKIANWPSGVRCREFRDISSSAWRPATRITQISV